MTKPLTGRCLILLLCAVLALGLFTAAASADDGITTWAELQTAINAGGTVTLTQSITATSDDSALTVPKNVTVILNLNGCTLSRGLIEPTKNGSVIFVNGTLTITGSGTITGGNTNSVGGGIWVKTGGSCTLSGGMVSGNHANQNGGGVYVSGTDAHFTLNGGTIMNNTAPSGGGIAFSEGKTLSIQSGSITGNIATNKGGGVWFNGYTYDESSYITGGSIANNTAGISGGGIYMNKGLLQITGGSITGNAAPDGADIAQKDDNSTVRYGISIDSQITNGTVTATVENEAVVAAPAGGTVALTIQPNPGCEVSTVKVNGEVIQPVDGTYSFVMPASYVTVTAQFSVNWSGLQMAFSAGGIVTLPHDITAGAGDSALTVPSGKTVTLNLNGHTLSRGLQSAAENGCVILNNGTLTITDSAGGGAITGGNNTGNGGGVNNTGTLTLAGGAITGNTAGESAGGAWNQSGAVFTMTGGIITGNTAVGYHGGGVYNGGTMNLRGGSITGNQAQGGLGSGQGGGVLNNGTLNVSGAPVVSGNTGPDGNNIYMRSACSTMTVTGALTDGANLYVTSARGTDTITGGYGTYNGSAYPVNYLHADNANYGVALTSNGEVEIITLLQITVETTAHGSLTADKTKASPGETVTLTAEPDEGYWLSSVILYDTSNQLIRVVSLTSMAFYMPDQDIVVKPEFTVKKTVSTDVLYPFAGLTMHVHGTLTADKETAEGSETVTLLLSTDAGYGLKTGGITAYKCLGSEQSAITVTEQADGTWTFTMPDGDYTVTAYAEIEWKNAPPSGSRMPYFYIDGTMTGGTVSAGSVPVLTPPVSPSNLYQPSVTQITMTATPDEGYVLKGWEVAAVNSSGEPLSQGYSLPAEREGSTYILSFDKVNNNYIFRIRAIFEEVPQLIPVNVSATDKSGTINRGSTMTASPAEAYAGDQITLTAGPVEGAKLSALQIFYTPRVANAQGTYTNYIMPAQDGNTFTFTVPQGISPNDANICVTASFEDDAYGITVPANQDAKVGTVAADKTTAAKGETITLTATVAGNVTFNPVNNLSVSYTDGNHKTHTVPVTLTDTVDLTTLIYYTCTFTMPAYPVDISANFAQKAFRITRADVSQITPAANRPETTITVAGFDVSTDHVYARANEEDAVALAVIAPNGADNTKQAVRGIYYTLDDDPEGTHYDLAVTLDEFRNPTASFAMPAGDITLHYVIETAYAVLFDTNEVYGTAYADKRYAFEGETITVVGTPDNSVYQHDRLACTAQYSGGEVDVTVVDGAYMATFTMPGAPVVVTPEFQMENVPYIKYSYTDGTLTSTQETAVRYFTLSSSQSALTSELYVAKANVSWNSSLTISGNANLILMDGVTLTAKGVVISGTNELTIYGQTQSSGQLKSNGTGENPGITLMEGGKLTVHGGVITAAGHSNYDVNNTTGAGGAGIGGKFNKDMNGTLTVYGGTVNATGGTRIWQVGYTSSEGYDYDEYSGGGAGIGGGCAYGGGTVVIYGGTVNAQAGCGAGIGAGAIYGARVNHDKEEGANVTILGGFVKATPRYVYHSIYNCDNNYQAIGGKKSSGSLTLGSNMLVKVNGQAYSGSAGVEKARSKAQIIITMDPSSAQPEPPVHSIVFFPGSENADGSMEMVTISDGETYQLPGCAFTAPEGTAFKDWSVVIGEAEPVTKAPSDTITVTAHTTVTAVWESIPFGAPDFVIPAGVTAIETSAFEGVAATIVEIPANCTSIGDYAFKNCAHLTQIRIPADCALGTDVFDGCEKVYVFSAAGSPAEAYCSAPGHGNCVFIAEAQSGTGE